MIDHAQHIASVVRDELAKSCTANGVNKDDAGYSVGGGGMVGPVLNEDRQMVGLSPTWTFTVSLRSKLLGKPRVGGSLPIYEVLPPDEIVRAVVARLVSEMADMRDKEFRGEKLWLPIICPDLCADCRITTASGSRTSRKR